MPPMPDIARLLHLQPSAYQVPISRPSFDPINADDDLDSDDSHTLVEVMKGQGKKAS
jgi:hypothetical protein